jgi:signal transduction histidine kinase
VLRKISGGRNKTVVPARIAMLKNRVREADGTLWIGTVQTQGVVKNIAKNAFVRV